MGQVCLPIGACAAGCSIAAECAQGEKCSSSGGCVPANGCGADLDCTGGNVCDSSAACVRPCQETGCSASQECKPDGHCVDKALPAQTGQQTGQDGGPASCGGQLFEATRIGANFLIVLDHSGSMRDQVGGVSKWSAASSAVRAVTAKHEAQIRFGLHLFSTAGRPGCDPGSTPVAIGDLRAAAISAALPADADGNGTPIAGALKLASAQPELADTTRSNNVLLVTDGKHNCDGKPVDEVKALRAQGVKTYVVGFGGQVDQDMLGTMAVEGGTARGGTPAYYQADDPTALNAALESIAAGSLGCDYQLTKAPPDPAKIYVYVNGALAPKDVTNGWQFDAARNRIGLFGATCSEVTRNPAAKVSIVYGCPDDSLVEKGPGTGGRDAGSGGGIN